MGLNPSYIEGQTPLDEEEFGNGPEKKGKAIKILARKEDL